MSEDKIKVTFIVTRANGRFMDFKRIIHGRNGQSEERGKVLLGEEINVMESDLK